MIKEAAEGFEDEDPKEMPGSKRKATESVQPYVEDVANQYALMKAKLEEVTANEDRLKKRVQELEEAGEAARKDYDALLASSNEQRKEIGQLKAVQPKAGPSSDTDDGTQRILNRIDQLHVQVSFVIMFVLCILYV